MIRVPVNINIPDYYFLKSADVVVERIGDQARAVDRHGNLIVEGTDNYNVLKTAVEDVVGKKALNMDEVVIRVLAVGLEGEVKTGWDNELIPARPLWGTGKRIKLLEFYCLGCKFKQPDTERGMANFLVVNDDYIENLRFIAYGSEFTVANVIWIGSAYYSGGKVPRGVSVLKRIHVEGFEMNTMTAFTNGGRWGGFGIYHGWPSNQRSDGYYVDEYIIKNITARPYIRDDTLPECVLLQPERARRLVIENVDAVNGGVPDDYGWYSPYDTAIEMYGYPGGNSIEDIIIKNSRLFGILSLYGRYIRISDSVVGREIAVAPHVKSVDEDNKVINAYDDSVILITNSVILGYVQPVSKYIIKESTSDTYTIEGSISIKVSNSFLSIDYGSYWGTYGAAWRSNYPPVDVRELTIENCEVVQNVGLSGAHLVGNLVGGYFKLIKLKSLRIYGPENPSLLTLTNTQGRGYDTHIERLVIDDVIVDSQPTYAINIYVDTSKSGNVIIDDMRITNLFLKRTNAWRIENAQVTLRELKPWNHREVSSGFITVGAGATLTLSSVSVPSTSRLIVGELHLYDPDGYMKLQIYNATDGIVAKEIGPGSTVEIGWFYFDGGKTYEFRLVNTDTANPHNANAKVVYAQMP